MKKIGGGRFLQELSLLRGEVHKLFMHFAGHQVSDFKAKMHQIRFRLDLRGPTSKAVSYTHLTLPTKRIV